MKTISELNAKWWYRLLKVAFVVLFVLASFAAVIDVYEQNAPYQIKDYEKSTVTCLEGNKKRFSQDELYLSNEKLEYQSIFVLCDLPADYRKSVESRLEQVQIESKSQGMFGDLFGDLEKTRAIKSEVENKVSYMTAQKTVGSLTFAIFASFVALVMTIAFFELIRRIFYYIVLGSLRPKKNLEGGATQ